MKNNRKKLLFWMVIDTCISFALGGAMIYFGEKLIGSLFFIFTIIQIILVILQIRTQQNNKWGSFE